MSLPDEEIRALHWGRQLLCDLAYGYHWHDSDKFQTVESPHTRVPKSVKEYARGILRHYPGRSTILACWRKADSSSPSPRRANSKRVVTRRSQARK